MTDLDLSAFSTDALLTAMCRLTHQMHGRHTEDAADERAQRDLIRAEVVRRTNTPGTGRAPEGTPERVNLTAAAIVMHDAHRGGGLQQDGADAVWDALTGLTGDAAAQVVEALVSVPNIEPDVFAYVPAF